MSQPVFISGQKIGFRSDIFRVGSKISYPYCHVYKSPTKLNAVEIKFDMVICLRIGKTTKAKIPPGDFQVTTPKNPLINNQAITSKKNLTNYPWPIPNYQPTIESSLQYPIGLDLIMTLFLLNA